MRLITILNPKVLDVPYTLVSRDYTSGTTLHVEDSSGFADNDLILVGGLGNEKAEVTDLTSAPPNNTSFNVTAMKFSHDPDESIEKVLFNQYDIQYKTSATGDWVSLVTGQNFDWGKERTEYVHSAGLSTNYYRSRYYNSATTAASDWSDSVIGTGYTRNQVGWVIERIRMKAQDENKEHAKDKEIIGSINTVNDIIKGMNRRWWFLKKEHEFDTKASKKEYDLPSDFDRAYRLKINFDDGTNNLEYYLRYLTPMEFNYQYRDLDAEDDDNIVHYTIDDVNNQVLLGPVPETAGYTMTLVYFKELSDVDTYGDELEVPLADLYVHYATAEIWERKDNLEKSKYHQDQFSAFMKILEQMRVKSYHPRSMKRYRGRNPLSRYYGSRNTYSDEEREKYY